VFCRPAVDFYTNRFKADFKGKCTVQKIDQVSGQILATFGYTYAVGLVDGNRTTPAAADRYGIVVYNARGGIWRRIGGTLSPVALGGGNIVIQGP
jgi:hypothetical protein